MLACDCPVRRADAQDPRRRPQFIQVGITPVIRPARDLIEYLVGQVRIVVSQVAATQLAVGNGKFPDPVKPAGPVDQGGVDVFRIVGGTDDQDPLARLQAVEHVQEAGPGNHGLVGQRFHVLKKHHGGRVGLRRPEEIVQVVFIRALSHPDGEERDAIPLVAHLDQVPRHHGLARSRWPHEEESPLVAGAQGLEQVLALVECRHLPLDVLFHVIRKEDRGRELPGLHLDIRPIENRDVHLVAAPADLELRRHRLEKGTHQFMVIRRCKVLVAELVLVTEIGEQVERPAILGRDQDDARPDGGNITARFVSVPETETRVAGLNTPPVPILDPPFPGIARPEHPGKAP